MPESVWAINPCIVYGGNPPNPLGLKCTISIRNKISLVLTTVVYTFIELQSQYLVTLDLEYADGGRRAAAAAAAAAAKAQ